MKKPKNRLVHFRLSTEDHQRLLDNAGEDGCSGYARIAVLERMARGDAPATKGDIAELRRELLGEFQKLVDRVYPIPKPGRIEWGEDLTGPPREGSFGSNGSEELEEGE